MPEELESDEEEEVENEETRETVDNDAEASPIHTARSMSNATKGNNSTNVLAEYFSFTWIYSQSPKFQPSPRKCTSTECRAHPRKDQAPEE